MPATRPAHPTRHVVAVLTEDLVRGRLAPGAPLTILALAERFALSPTPVREALARLTGAGWVVAAEGGGYACAPLDAARLEGLRRLERLLLEHALEIAPSPLEAAGARLARRLAADADAPAALHWLFAERVALMRDPVFADAFGRISVRLGVVRRAEALGRPGELAELARGFESAHDSARTALATYFARRSGREAQTYEEVAALAHAAEDL